MISVVTCGGLNEKDTDKDEYIIKSLASIGKRKKWELYVVTRIIHLLKNNDLEFTCQQYVKQKDLDGYFFTDLCFPSLDLYIEVNEMQHDDSKEQTKKDKELFMLLLHGSS